MDIQMNFFGSQAKKKKHLEVELHPMFLCIGTWLRTRQKNKLAYTVQQLRTSVCVSCTFTNGI